MVLSIQQVSSYSGFCLSFLINNILMYMIRAKTTKQLGSYVYLMLSFSIFELVFSTVDVLNQPMIYVNNGEFIFFSTNPLHLNNTIAKHFNLINFACSGIIISLLAIHFFYRYMAVSNNQQWLKQFEMPKFFIWIFIFVVFGFEWYLVSLLLGDTSRSVCVVDINSLTEYYDADPMYAVFIGIKYHASTPLGVTLCVKSILLALVLLKIVLISCIIVIYCGIKIWREISVKRRAVSRRTLDMQRQFFRALVAQTLIPVFLLYLPLTTMLLAPILNANLHKLDVIIQFAFVFYPILDPIAVLFIVRDYRKTIRAFLNEQVCQRFWSLFKCIFPCLFAVRSARSSPPPPPIPHVQTPVIPRFIY